MAEDTPADHEKEDRPVKTTDAQDVDDDAKRVIAAPADRTIPAVPSKARRKRVTPSKSSSLPTARPKSRPTHLSSSQSGRPAIFVVAGAVATACLGYWFARRRQRRRHASTPQLLTECKLEPSHRVQHASPPPPLHTTSFVTTDV